MTLLENSQSSPPLRWPALCQPRDLRILLETAAALAFDVPPDALRKTTRGPAAVAFARQAAMYLAHVVTGLSYSDVSRLFRRHRTTVAYAIQLVEDRRDERDIDIRLDLLESVCADAIKELVEPQPVRQ
jgi:hypothetical protein